MRTLLVIAIFALAACGGAKKPPAAPAESPPPPAESAPTEEKTDADGAAPEGGADKATADPCEGGE